jgi:hypothetical protein
VVWDIQASTPGAGSERSGSWASHDRKRKMGYSHLGDLKCSDEWFVAEVDLNLVRRILST